MASNWFYCPKPKPNARLKFFIFPHAGGSSLSYAKWRDLVPEDVEMQILEMPGRGARHREELAVHFEPFLAELKSAYEALPIFPAIFFGHSMGSIIALELCRALSRKYQNEVRGLAVSAFLPPTPENLRARVKLAGNSDEQLIEWMKKFGSLPADFFKDLTARAYFLKIIRGDVTLFDSYSTKNSERVRCPLMVFGGRDDKTVSESELSRWARFGDILGDVQMLPGGHFYLFEQAPAVFASLREKFFG
jgi:surfactin synthase thioesterase subunit